MALDPFYTIEIKEGFCAGADTNISPAQKTDDPWGYIQNEDQMISIGWVYLYGFLGSLLDKYYSADIQMPYYDDLTPYEYYDDYGWNFYTAGQIRSILAELQEFVDVVSKNPFGSKYTEYLKPNNAKELCAYQQIDFIMQQAAQLMDFYPRFIERMNRMLDNMGNYDFILFVGP